MIVILKCKANIKNFAGEVIFEKDSEYKGDFYEDKGRIYAVKDSSGLLHSIPEGLFFNSYFEVIWNWKMQQS